MVTPGSWRHHGIAGLGGLWGVCGGDAKWSNQSSVGCFSIWWLSEMKRDDTHMEET